MPGFPFLPSAALIGLKASSRTSRSGSGSNVFLIVATAIVLGVFIWQGVTAKGAPDPTQPHTSQTVAMLDIAVLVFREGLECILVLSAITASMVGDHRIHRRPVAVGAGIGFIATLITWFIAVGIVSSLAESVPALQLQAATGLLAVIVLLVVMNWFFHKVYWGGWIGLHNKKKKDLLNQADGAEISDRRLIFGLGLLGFASLYREGFEVVLFLQGYYLQMGGADCLRRRIAWDPFIGLDGSVDVCGPPTIALPEAARLHRRHARLCAVSDGR